MVSTWSTTSVYKIYYYTKEVMRVTKVTLDQEYKLMKEKHKDSILFYQVGQFYQTYYYDATILAKVGRFQLRTRAMGGGVVAPVCGVPINSLNKSLELLQEAGYSIVVCEQYKYRQGDTEIVKRDRITEYNIEKANQDLVNAFESYMDNYSYKEAKEEYDKQQFVKIQAQKLKQQKEETAFLVKEENRGNIDVVTSVASYQSVIHEANKLDEILTELRTISIEQMTPLECMSLLSRWKQVVI